MYNQTCVCCFKELYMWMWGGGGGCRSMTRHGPIVMYFSGLNTQMHHSWEHPGFCPPGILSAWILSSMGFCPCGVLSPWAFVPLGFCLTWILSPWAFVPMGFCPPGLLSSWDFVRLDIVLWVFVQWDFVLEPPGPPPFTEGARRRL